MSEEIKSVDEKIDEAEAAVKKYASKDTVISIGGYEFTPAKLMVAFTIVSSTLGGLYGAFEVYKDYQSMKKKIAEYVAPDLEEVYKKLEVIQVESSKTAEYTRDIKNDLKSDIRRLESTVEQVERSQKQTSRETAQDVNEVRRELKTLDQNVDKKIQKALDNPLAK
jgi:Mg2+ and Co2+ transporter CorA